MIDVSDSDIAYTEKILLDENFSFDEERRIFIKDFSTLDLQAVPGSGKTTVLLAKLLILDKKMPLHNGRGVLVISHTNAAVDEIYSRIGKYAPNLFRYPNFVGTIQSFVDNYLAIPYYLNKYKKRPYRIDDEIYNEKIEKGINNLWFHRYGLSVKTIQQVAYIKNVNESLFYNYRFHLDGDKPILTKALNDSELVITKPLARTKKENYIDYSPEEKSNIYTWFKKFKIDVLKNEEVLHFDDAYFLANLSVKKNPKIVSLLQKRFQYVFVDEMQDMDIHQHDLLEDIFFEKGTSSSFFQRIGDINQAIYNGNSIHITDIWSHRENTLQIRGSHRLNNKLAPIIQRFGLTAYQIEGLKRNDDQTEIDIKPHILIFDDTTKENVIPKFAEIIIQLQSENKIPTPAKHKFMALAWRKEHDDDDKLGLADYWKSYLVLRTKTKIDYKVLKDYLLFFDRTKETLETVRKQILNALLKILRLENVLDEDNRVYSKRKLLNTLKKYHFNEYENLKLLIYQWSISCINEKTEHVYLSFKEYIPIFLAHFGKAINNSKAFIEGESDVSIEQIESIEKSNIYERDNIKIEIGTVHSVKGQTHTATLYLETFYERGYGNYESERLRNQFLGEELTITLPKLTSGIDKVKQSTKMVYVGFSRPTHLLCFAVHKNRFSEYLSDIDQNIWEVIDISSRRMPIIKSKVQFPNANKQPKPLF